MQFQIHSRHFQIYSRCFYIVFRRFALIFDVSELIFVKKYRINIDFNNLGEKEDIWVSHKICVRKEKICVKKDIWVPPKICVKKAIFGSLEKCVSKNIYAINDNRQHQAASGSNSSEHRSCSKEEQRGYGLMINFVT